MDDGRRGTTAITDLLDLHEGRLDVPLLDDAAIRELLTATRRIAVVGASDRPDRPSHRVLLELRDAGFDAIPVNPNVTHVAGLACYPSLTAAVAATGPVDIVDVFRRAGQCVEPAREAVETGARCLWLQLGIADRAAGRIASDAGLMVVMDRCTIIEVRRTRLAAPS